MSPPSDITWTRQHPVTDLSLVDGKWIDPSAPPTNQSAQKTALGDRLHREEIDRVVHEAGIHRLMGLKKRDIFKEYASLAR